MDLGSCTPDGDPKPTEIHVRMQDGRLLRAHTGVARGERNKNPLSREEIKEKFRSNVNYSRTLSTVRAEQALKMVENLEEIKDIKELIRLLV